MVESSQTRQLNIKQMNGDVVSLEVNPDIPISDLKTMIEEKTNMPKAYQRIIYKAKHVDDASKLSDFVKEDGQTMHLIKKVQEQSQSSQEEQKQSQDRPNVSQGQSSGAQQDPFAMINNMMRSMNQGGAQSNPLAMFQQMTYSMQAPEGESQNNAASQMLSSLMQPPSANQATQGNQTSQGLPPQLSQMLNSIMSPVTEMPQQQQQQQQQPQPQQQQDQPQNQSSGGSQSQSSGLSGGIIKLPHENVYDLNMLCNRLMGNNSVFPGSPIPQLPFDRNPMVLLGSYLCNMAFALQRLLPFMQRCGDLMQRESLLTVASHRHKTSELVMVLGECLEEVSRITGSTAHLYKNLEVGPQPGNFRLDVQSYDAMFEQIVRSTDSVQAQGENRQQQQPQQQQNNSQGQSQTQSQPQQQTTTTSQAPAATEIPKNFVKKLIDQFGIPEAIQISKGNITEDTVPNFPERLRAILVSELENEQDTPQNRKKLCDNLIALVKQSMSIPEESKSAVHEGFDPCLMTTEYLEENIPSMFDALLDCESSSFLVVMKARMIQFIGGIVSEIQDGFVNGSDDVFPFLKENLMAFNKIAAPVQALLLNNMVVNPLMEQFQAAFGLYQEQISQQAQQTTSNSVSLNASAESPEARRQKLLEHYKLQGAKDQEVQNQLGNRPLSRAYLSLDTTTNNEVAGDESKQAKESYVRDKEEKAKARPHFFKTKLREGIIDSGMFKSAAVDREMKTIDELPQELVQAYFDLMQKGIKFRITNDQDYQKLKNQGRFEHLDKL